MTVGTEEVKGDTTWCGKLYLASNKEIKWKMQTVVPDPTVGNGRQWAQMRRGRTGFLRKAKQMNGWAPFASSARDCSEKRGC